MEIAGYLAAVLIGISLGLIGSGGSILTVPVLVYLFGIHPLIATTYSLFIVGVTSIAGSFNYFKQGLVSIPTILFFGIPSVTAVFLTRTYILPAIPQEIVRIDQLTVTKNILLMLLFAVLMIAASYSMIRKKPTHCDVSKGQKTNLYLLSIQGLFTGAITGLIGAGGGFLIIPALVNFLKMPIKTAIGTSLMIVAMNSLTGFVFSISHHAIQWPFLGSITGIAIGGILIGSFLSKKVDSKQLKPAFGWFILVMGIYIITKEIFVHA